MHHGGDDVWSGRCPAWTHCAGFASGVAVVPPCRPCCLVECFTWRHSARVISSPALHACFAARAPCRTSRRSSRRSMPCVWADAGTACSSITTEASAAAPLPREIRIPFCLRCLLGSVLRTDGAFTDRLLVVLPPHQPRTSRLP